MKAKLYTGMLLAMLTAGIPVSAQYADDVYLDDDDTGTTIVNNYYDNYDYFYSSRINRFHRSFSVFDYYSPIYTDTYWYTYQPLSWGISIYGGGLAFSLGYNFCYPVRFINSFLSDCFWCEWNGWDYPCYYNDWSYEPWYNNWWYSPAFFSADGWNRPGNHFRGWYNDYDHFGRNDYRHSYYGFNNYERRYHNPGFISNDRYSHRSSGSYGNSQYSAAGAFQGRNSAPSPAINRRPATMAENKTAGRSVNRSINSSNRYGMNTYRRNTVNIQAGRTGYSGSNYRTVSNGNNTVNRPGNRSGYKTGTGSAGVSGRSIVAGTSGNQRYLADRRSVNVTGNTYRMIKSAGTAGKTVNQGPGRTSVNYGRISQSGRVGSFRSNTGMSARISAPHVRAESSRRSEAHVHSSGSSGSGERGRRR